MASPGFLSHFVMVPSVMDSPIWGITTSVGMNFSSPLISGAVYKCGRFKPSYIGPVRDRAYATGIIRLLDDNWPLGAVSEQRQRQHVCHFTHVRRVVGPSIHTTASDARRPGRSFGRRS